MKKHILFLVVIYFGINNAFAYSGNELLQQCNDNRSHEQIVCMTYIQGFTSGYNSAQEFFSEFRNLSLKLTNEQESAEILASRKYGTCIPPKATMKQLALVAVKYMNENPKYLHHDAGFTLANAFYEAFPCR